MFLYILLDTEYMGCEARIKWYLKILYQCSKSGWGIVTHNILNQRYEQLTRTVDQRFFNEFEMNILSKEEYESIPKYFIDDSIFKTLEEKCGSRSNTLKYLYKENFLELTDELARMSQYFFEYSRGEKIQGIFNSLEPFYSTQLFCKQENIPLYSYTFSAIRKVHGYHFTLYLLSSNNSLYNSLECRSSYNSFLSKRQNINIFNHEVLLALFGKKINFPLIPYINKVDTDCELLICGEPYNVLPHIFEDNYFTDDDLMYESDKIFNNQKVIYRCHPLRVSRMGISWEDTPNDPLSTILRAKRVTSVSSQMLLKSMLWNKPTICLKDTLPFSFKCEKNLKALKTVDLHFINFYLFCYLIPDSLFFDKEYWTWRETIDHDSMQVYNKHLKYYSNIIGIDLETIAKNKNQQRILKEILIARGCSTNESNLFSQVSNSISPYIESPIAALKVLNKQNEIIFSGYRITLQNPDGICMSSFLINLEHSEKIYFAPLPGVCGNICLESIHVYTKNKGTELITFENNSHYSFNKNDAYIMLPIPSSDNEITEVTISWTHIV